jgi:hypothetical protein
LDLDCAPSPRCHQPDKALTELWLTGLGITVPENGRITDAKPIYTEWLADF